jgi:outer membrane lipoprotein-sorting protein
VGFVLLSWITAAIATQGASTDDKGRSIIRKVIEQDDGFGDFRSDVEMIIVDDDGGKRVRKMRVSDLEIAGGGEKRLFVFDFPNDVKGTAVLSHTRSTDEKQWIFLPAFKRVKRISSANKSSPFVGSEFSYEDLASVELDKYRYNYIKTINDSGCDCDVVEMVPDYDNSGYQKQVAYIDREKYIFRKMEYYDNNGELLKTLELDSYKLYLDQYWRPLKLKMTNHQSNRKTLMVWSDVKYGNGLSDRDLSVNALKRSR